MHHRLYASQVDENGVSSTSATSSVSVSVSVKETPQKIGTQARRLGESETERVTHHNFASRFLHIVKTKRDDFFMRKRIVKK